MREKWDLRTNLLKPIRRFYIILESEHSPKTTRLRFPGATVIFDTFGRKAALAVVVILITAVYLAGSAMAVALEDGAETSPVVEWTLHAELTVPAGEGVRGESDSQRAGTLHVDALTTKLNAAGAVAGAHVSARTEEKMTYSLSVSGKSDVQHLRSLLYGVARPEFDLLGGETEVEITGVSEGKSMVIVLESNPSTGYRWRSAGNSSMVESAPAEYQKHTPGYGTPERQVIRLVSAGTGPCSVKLLYKRGWEDVSPLRRLKIVFPSFPAKLDLSDPDAPGTLAPLLEDEAGVEDSQLESVSGLPAHFDWRDYGIVTPVRNQGICGGCWAFGTVGVMESALWKNGIANVNLSEQFLLDCNTDHWTCNGGLTAHKYHYDVPGSIQRVAGAVLEAEKPYASFEGSCTRNYRKPYVLKGWKFISGSESTVPTVDEIKSAIYQYGPVAAGVCVGEWFHNYLFGTFATDESTSCGGHVNHLINLVGWDDEGRYWILRNSWGAVWGTKGYMHIRWGVSKVGRGASYVLGAGPSETFLLTVSRTGTGTGSVKSAPDGVDCGETCVHGFLAGTDVALVAVPAPGSSFEGWGGPVCSGTGKCLVTMDQSRSETASFGTCSYSIVSARQTDFGANGGSVTVKISADSATCASPVITVPDGSWLAHSGLSMKKGKGSVKIKASGNASSFERSGVVMIGGDTLEVRQKGKTCALKSLKPSRVSFDSEAHGGNVFSVAVIPSDCRWNAATNNTDWIQIISGATGTDGGSVTYDVLFSDSSRNRTGKIDVTLALKPGTKKTFTVIQSKKR